MLQAARQGVAGERHDALIALAVAALVDREGEVALPEELRHRRLSLVLRHQPLDALVVEAGIAAHRAIGGDVDHQHAQRPGAAGRPEERGGGKAWVSTGRSWGSRYA